jgi:hypothetical protein
VQALKGSEELAGVCHVEAGTIIAHEIRHLPVHLRDAKFNPCVGVLAGVLPRVAEQVSQRHP